MKIEIVDGLQEGEVRASSPSAESRLLTVRDLLGGEQGQEIAIRPPLPLRPVNEAAPDPTGIRQVQPFEEGIEIRIGGDHDRPPARREDAAVRDRVQRLRCRLPDTAATRWARCSDQIELAPGWNWRAWSRRPSRARDESCFRR